MPGDVFISYASADADSAAAVCRALEDAGLSCWMAPRDLPPGALYAEAIVAAIGAARASVVLLSEAANGSQFVVREVERAASRRVPLVPVRLDDTDPSPALEFFLGALQRLDMPAPPREEDLTQLVRVLTSTVGTPVPHVSNLPSRNGFFTGRDTLIERVGSTLERAGRVGITGMPGVGKTQVALEYAARQRERYDALLWMHADSRDSLYGDTARIARLLRLPDHSDSRQDRVLESLRDWLATHDGWLLVLDNVDDFETVAPLLSVDGPGHVLVTARETGGQSLAERVQVEPLDEESSAALLLRRSYRPEAAHEDDARAVATRLGGLPLALDQAGAFIEQTRSTPAEYLRIFDSEAASLLAERDPGGGSVAATLALAFDRLRDEDQAAADVLKLCAVFAPDAIPEEILTTGRCCEGEPLGAVLEHPLSRLKTLRSAIRYALLDRDPDTRSLSVHRLVQTVLVAPLPVGEREAWATHAGRALAAAFPVPDYTNWALCERLAPHVLACAEHLDRLGVEFKALGRLLSLVAVYLRQRSRQAEAQPLQERAYAMLERTAGDDRMALAWSLHNLGVLDYDYGRLARADERARRALAIAEEELGPLDARLTWFLGTLARLARTHERYADAEALLRRSIAIRRAADPPDPVQTAWPLQGLGDLYLETGRPRDAEAVLSEALALRRANLGPRHPHLAWTMTSLAGALAEQGDYEAAMPLLREGMELAEAALGPKHKILGVILDRYASVVAARDGEAAAGPIRARAQTIRASGR
jgi:tetratricopeptide (TPR) repeat protein